MSGISVADRIDIQDLLVRYCYAVDDKDWTAFEALFSPDAVIDFSAFGGPRCSAPEMADFLRATALQVPSWQHTISTVLLTRADDEGADAANDRCEAVRTRVAAQVMMISKNSDACDRVMFTGLWYRDLVVRTAHGWKIKERVQERSWVHNVPTS